MAKKKKAKARKSSKRSRAAKKAARTRKENHEKRVRAGKKAARSRKRSRGGSSKKRKSGRKGKARRRSSKRRRKNPVAAAPKRKSSKKRKASKKSGKRKSRKKGYHYRAPEKVYEETLRTQQRCEARIARLKAEGQKAIGQQKERKQKEIARLEQKQARLQAQLNREKAAAGERRRGKRRGRGGKRRRNPINPISGWGEAMAGVGGVLVGGLFTIGGDRFAATHAVTATGTAGSFTDAPANQGDVYNVSAPNLPIWSNITRSGWMRIVSAALNVGVPLFIADKVQHQGTKTFFQLWGYSAIAITGAKVATDLTAKLASSSATGMRLFAPESTAVSMQGQSNTTLPTSITIVQGEGFQPTLTGYGKSKNGKRTAGAGGCSSCGCAPGGNCGCAATLGAQPALTPPLSGATSSTVPSGAQPSGPGQTTGTQQTASSPVGVRKSTQSNKTLYPFAQGGTNTGLVGTSGAHEPGAVVADATAGGGRNNIGSPTGNVHQMRPRGSGRRWA